VRRLDGESMRRAIAIHDFAMGAENGRLIVKNLVVPEV